MPVFITVPTREIHVYNGKVSVPYGGPNWANRQGIQASNYWIRGFGLGLIVRNDEACMEYRFGRARLVTETVKEWEGSDPFVCTYGTMLLSLPSRPKGHACPVCGGEDNLTGRCIADITLNGTLKLSVDILEIQTLTCGACGFAEQASFFDASTWQAIMTHPMDEPGK